MKTLLLLLSLCVLAAILSLAHIHREASAAYEASLCGVASDEHKAALKYHGVKVAYQVKGEWRFMRQGRECKLFTASFRQFWTGP